MKIGKRCWLGLIAGLLLLASEAGAQCTLDLKAGVMSNQVVRLQLPRPGTTDAVRIYYGDRLASPDDWYYFTCGSSQSPKSSFRSTGKVLKIVPAEATPECAKVRIIRLTDDPQEPDLGAFELTYEIHRGAAVVRHAMTFTPRLPVLVRSYQFFVATEKPGADTHRFHFIEPGWRIGSQAARTGEPYGRIAFPCRHPWLALEEIASRRSMALGAPPADVRHMTYAVEFKRFELSRTGGRVTAEEPLRDFAWIAFGDDAAKLVEVQRACEAQTDRPPRDTDAVPPAPQLAKAAPSAHFARRIADAGNAYEVQARDFKLTMDKNTGAISQCETAQGKVLDESGGIVFVRWPQRRRIGPQGAISSAVLKDNQFSYLWTCGDLETRNTIEAHDRHIIWTVSLPNRTHENLLVEARLSLPVRLGDDRWFYWNGLELKSVGSTTRECEMTTLVPGEVPSQGVFPAVCLHNERQGIAIGMEPDQIESFYGSRVSPADGKQDTFYYAVRLAIPPGKTREMRFVIYVTDPNWSWRSCIDRYWSFWPEVFAAPKRDDIWGLYASSAPGFIHKQGDKFIELCRRMRVGAMELYAPFNTTGHFYPDTEPAVTRDKTTLTQKDMRRLYETADIACCNLSYVIPTKCEREMAKAKYADSIIRMRDGSFFFMDTWDVMGGHREKLAGMFAWGDSFGENLRKDLRQIVANYHPDGFYMDNGAFVWQDYGRMTEWSAFDDDGRIYTNAGIAYAKLLDDLRDFAPQVHRNPGEFIQYFSGFRAQSYLTNCTDTQAHYVRSHRLTMGYKPIFPGLPDRFGSKASLFDALEMGGLPWLGGFKRDLEPFAQAWAPVAVALARAGWRPIPLAVADPKSVRVERFGEGQNALFTVRNLSEAPVAARVTFLGNFPQLCDFHGKLRLEPRADAATGLTQLSVNMPAEEMIFLRATPAPPASPRNWPKASFLAAARPTSIILQPNATVAERHTARRVKAFIELQAELLKQTAEVEIIELPASPRHQYRVVIEPSTGPTTISESVPDALTIGLLNDDETHHVLSDFLDTLAKPFTSEKPKWLP